MIDPTGGSWGFPDQSLGVGLPGRPPSNLQLTLEKMAVVCGLCPNAKKWEEQELALSTAFCTVLCIPFISIS